MRVLAVISCLAWAGLVTAATAQSDTYTRAFPETGARVAVFEAGMGFREEMFALDEREIFDAVQPGQPPVFEAHVIVARVPSWEVAVATFEGTALQGLADEAEALSVTGSSETVLTRQTTLCPGHPVLTVTFLNEAEGTVIHARCAARFLHAVIEAGATDPDFDMAACSRDLD